MELCWAQAEMPVANTDALQLQSCELPGVGAAPAVRAECGRLQVAENPAQSDGAQISLRVARIPAQAKQPLPDPVFLFAGGPGQAATEIYPAVAPIFRELNQQRDIILIDQRGTGGSNKLACPFELEDLESQLNLALVRESTEQCLRQLTADPRYYTTSIAMSDYERVRQVLGYAQINLWGGSYGTRAAQVYLRQYPAHVRSMVLDSVVPPRLALGSEHARQLDRVLTAVFARCRADTACDQAFPQLEQGYQELLHELTTNPQSITLSDPNTAEPVKILADRNLLAAGLRFLSYSSVGQSLIPQMLQQAIEGHPEALYNSALVTVSGLTEQLARGMELSVVCAEDEPLMGDGQDEADTLVGSIMVEVLHESCKVWPRGVVPENFHQAYPSAVPTLLLAGEWDPVTPPIYAEEAAEQYSQGRLLVVPGQGHLVTPVGCVPELVTKFIRAADAQDLSVECLERTAAEPFFIDNNGPEA